MFGKKANNNERIKAVRDQREMCRNSIQSIKERMNKLIEDSIDVDELDKSINAMDYKALKQELAVAEEHFQDLSHVILQLQNQETASEQLKSIQDIIKARSAINIDEMIKTEDYISANREILQEEDEMYQSVRKQNAPHATIQTTDIDFERMVAKAAIQRNMATSDSEPLIAN